jgi:hypothetical protein
MGQFTLSHRRDARQALDRVAKDGDDAVLIVAVARDTGGDLA